MKKTLVALGMAFALTGMCGAATAAGAEPRSVSVTGEAEVKVIPDQVVLTLGVETSDKVLSAARSENDSRVKAIIAAAQGAGVAARDIQTDYIQIEPRYHDGYDQREFIGYFVQKTVVVTLRDISRFEGLLGSVLGAGANHVHGIEFRTSELRKHRDEARALAIRAAREKAQALAKELGQGVGAPRSISEGSDGWWSSYRGWWGRGWGQNQAQNVVQDIGGQGASGEGPLAPGTISVRASVSVTFELQ
jgi:uncharacterized protein